MSAHWRGSVRTLHQFLYLLLSWVPVPAYDSSLAPTLMYHPKECLGVVFVLNEYAIRQVPTDKLKLVIGSFKAYVQRLQVFGNRSVSTVQKVTNTVGAAAGSVTTDQAAQAQARHN